MLSVVGSEVALSLTNVASIPSGDAHLSGSGWSVVCISRSAVGHLVMLCTQLLLCLSHCKVSYFCVHALFKHLHCGYLEPVLVLGRNVRLSACIMTGSLILKVKMVCWLLPPKGLND